MLKKHFYKIVDEAAWGYYIPVEEFLTNKYWKEYYNNYPDAKKGVINIDSVAKILVYSKFIKRDFPHYLTEIEQLFYGLNQDSAEKNGTSTKSNV